MQPSTWNDTNQHWIPQFLLKGFGIPRNASRVYELDKQTNAIAVRNAREVASKPRLLTEQDDADLRRIENAAAKAMGMMRKNADVEDMRAGDVMDGFGALHDLVEAMESINPYIGVTAQGSRTIIIDAFVATVREAMEQKGERLDEQDLRKYIDERVNHEVLSANGIFRSLLRWTPHVHRTPDNEYFIIGDSPIIAIRSADGTPVQRALPVSSTRVVTFTYNVPRGRARILGENNTRTVSSTLTSDQVRSLNAHYFYRTSSRYIYGRDARILKQSATRPQEWTIPESTGRDFDLDLILELMATRMIASYQKADVIEAIRELPVSSFVRKARQIRRKQTS